MSIQRNGVYFSEAHCIFIFHVHSIQTYPMRDHFLTRRTLFYNNRSTLAHTSPSSTSHLTVQAQVVSVKSNSPLKLATCGTCPGPFFQTIVSAPYHNRQSVRLIFPPPLLPLPPIIKKKKTRNSPPSPHPTPTSPPTNHTHSRSTNHSKLCRPSSYTPS